MGKNMRLKKVALILILTFVTFFVASIFSASYAATGSMYLQIKMLRNSGYGYQALEKNIWKICEGNSSGTSYNYDKTIYCLKGGPGFGSSRFGSGTTKVREYTRYYDMKDPDSIPSTYASALPSTSSRTYKSLLWLLEHLYVAPKSNASSTEIRNAEEYRELLLSNAGIAGGYMTDDDIDAVQQLAVWHFTNDDEYKVENSSNAGTFELWINAISGSDANYNPMSDAINENGWDRAEECQTLYDYLVNEAEKAGSTYEVTTATTPYELANLTPTLTTEKGVYVIGPYRIDKVNETAATLNVTFKNGTTVINPTIITKTPVVTDAEGNKTGGQHVTHNSITEVIGQEFYITLPTTTELNKIILEMSGSYFDTTLTYWSVEGAPAEDQPVVVVERQKRDYTDSIEFTPQQEPEKIFDMALRKFIISINGVAPEVSREPQIDLSPLIDGTDTTAVKTHPKNALLVKTGDKVVYKIRVYNEGEVDGYVKEITDYLPTGLKFIKDSTINTNNGWTNPSGDGKTIVTDKLAGNLLKAFDGTNLQYIDVEIECEVEATVQSTDTLLKNIAEITNQTDADENKIKDKDSYPDNVNKDNYGTTSQEDDDDFEQLVILGQYFDLSLRKFITAVNDTELKDENGKYIREPQVDLSPLVNATDITAIYNHKKIPLGVSVGDEVIYTLRIYNEGQIDGYVNEIADYLPEYLEFVNDTFNASYGWTLGADGRTVKTTITSPDTDENANTDVSASRDILYANRKEGADKVILKAFDGTKLDYIDVKIKCKVKDTPIGVKVTNIAVINKSKVNEGNEGRDRDSKGDNITLPSDESLPNYKDTEINRGDAYIPGQQDDDDFEKVIVQKFDLALRKFITAVNDKEITNRFPVFSKDSKGNYKYTHPKTPVEVANKDIVTYTLRIYNEGNQSGYAQEVKDDLPEGLEFLPDNELNKEYKWVMYKEDGTKTEKVEEAKTIRTDYLSKEQEEVTGRKNLITAFNPETMTQPEYKEVKIAFKVTEPNTSDRILINTAEISEDADEYGEKVEDIDSTPDNDKEGEDDIDIEKVKVKYFDLALRKIISEVSMKLDGKTTVTKTGHTFEQEPEPVVKVELGNHKIKTSVIKFKYQIRVTNEGEIAGYVKEVKDYIPEGLKFVKADNPKWKLSEDGKTVTTDQLKDTLLEPGESAIVEITLQWINGQNNLGLKTNIAEISKDYNEHESPDIDSTPDNFKEGEDDIDDASVVLTIVTGITENYIAITASMLVILTAGIVLIKKFVI